MTRYLYANNATTTLAQSVSATTTIINVASGEGDLFPSPGAGEAFAITFVDAATGLQNEIAYCTSRSGDALTVVRGQENKNAREWSAGDTVANYITAGVIESWLQEADLDGYATTASVDTQMRDLVAGRWALGTTAYQVIGMNWQIADARPAVFYQDSSGNQHAGGEIAMYSDVTATQAWAKGQFLKLADADEQTVTGPVAFSGATPVPSVTAFTGTDALNAETAEGRYVKSVPATGQTRITDLVENSDGRAAFGDGTNNSVLALLSDLPVDEWTSYNSYPCLIRTWPNGCIEQFFYVYMPISGVNTVAYPQAYPDGTLPLVFPGAGFRSIDNHTGTLAFNSQTPDRSAVTATGFSAQAYAYTIGPVTWAGWIHVMGPATEAAS